MLNVIMLYVVKLNVIMLSVVAPWPNTLACIIFTSAMKKTLWLLWYTCWLN